MFAIPRWESITPFGVKAILAAGEVLPGSLVKRLEDTYKIRIYNGYGPTETTIGATITEAGDAVSIGTPIANMGIILLNGEKTFQSFESYNSTQPRREILP